MAEKQYGPLIGAGMLIGIGLGGLIESMAFRHILQSHTMLSTMLPQRNLPNFKTSLMWDGILELFLISALILGIVILYTSAKDKATLWSGQVLFGGWFLGWGLYTLAEGAVAHFLLKFHHLLAFSNPATQETGDYAYLGAGVLLSVLGFWAIQSTKAEIEEKEHTARRAQQRAKEVKGDKKVYLD